MKRTFLRPALKLSSLACAVVLLTACNEEEANTTSQQQPPPKVGFVTLEAQPYTLTTELPGRTAAYRIAEVRPQVTGIIQKRLFTEGTDIKAGDQLYQIDPAIYQANLKSAEANQIATRSLATRYKRLVDERAVSRQQYDDAHSAHLQAQAALEKAKIDLQYTQVKAPISGRIGRSSVTEGALVNNGQAQELAIIQQLDLCFVSAT
nr:efflux RND transporter periplasmic adaptor subunit [Thiopseudomonas alkaliphila]